MNKKQSFLHMVSVFTLLLLFVVFYVLGGGKQTSVLEIQEGINTVLPQAQQKDLAENKFEAFAIESNRNLKEKRRANLEGNSFDWYDSSTEELDEMQKNESTHEFIVEETEHDVLTSSLNDILNTCNTTQRPKESAVSKHSLKERLDRERTIVMQKKRTEFEQRMHLSLSDDSENIESEDDKKSEQKEVEHGSQAEENIIPNKKSGFYGLQENKPLVKRQEIKALIHGNHDNLAQGEIVKIRLLESLQLKDYLVPRNTFLYGELSFFRSRAMINIMHVNYKNRVLPLQVAIYDQDGLEGLHIPGNVLSETSKEIGSDMLGQTNLDISSPTGVLNTGVNAITGAIKGAVHNSVKENKISISSNYLVILKKK